jgi:membrane protein
VEVDQLGSAAAAILRLTASALFSHYAAHFGSPYETFGLLGAIIGFMTWLRKSAIMILLRAEPNAERSTDGARHDAGTG